MRRTRFKHHPPCTYRMPTNDLRKDAVINDAETGNAMDAQVVVNASTFRKWSHANSACGMVSIAKLAPSVRMETSK